MPANELRRVIAHLPTEGRHQTTLNTTRPNKALNADVPLHAVSLKR